MLRQRQNVTARCAKSRQTPWRSVVGFPRRSRGARVLVTEGHVGVYEVADRLHPRPAKRRRSEQAPRLVGKPIRLTVAASKQEQQGVRRQVLDLVLQGVQLGRLRRARITNDRIRAETEAAGGCNEAAAPVSETIAIALDRNRGRGHQVVRTLQVGEAREMHVQCHDHRCGLWKLEAELTADMDTHAGSLSSDQVAASMQRACRQPFGSSSTARTYLFIGWSILYRFNCERGACLFRPKRLLKAAGTLRQLFDRIPFGSPLLIAAKFVEGNHHGNAFNPARDSLTRLLQGAFAGFVATVVIGFGWGGWTLGSTAKQLADKNAGAAVVAVLAPMCADKFRHGADATANMARTEKGQFMDAGLLHRERRLGDISRKRLARP